MISVVVPTITGREHHLARCLAAYREHGGELELVVIEDAPTCGHAWEEGGNQAQGDYIHFSADDLVPHAGWWEAAVSYADKGELPCPRILRPDGSLESCGEWGAEREEGTETNIARIPFLSREMWEKGGWILRAHYYTDNFIWHRGQQLGIPTVIARGYQFTHYYAAEGRKTSIDQDLADYQAAGGAF
jgi:hypothetical protein